MEHGATSEADNNDKESSRIREIAIRINDFQTEINDLRVQSGDEYAAAYTIIERSLANVSLKANAIAEIMEHEGK